MEESAALITSIHASITTWFTPTILFIFLNLMIATILFTSNLPNNNPTKQQQQQQPPNQNDTVPSKITRSPSILHRLKSFTLYPPHSSQDEQQQQQQALAATQYVFSHPFTHEQDLLQPVSSTVKRFDLDPTRIEKDAPLVDDRLNHQQDLQPVSPNPKRSHFDPTQFHSDPTRFHFDPTRIQNDGFEGLTHEQNLKPVSANPKRFDFDPTRIEKDGFEDTTVSANLKRFDFDPTHVDSDPTRIENEVPTHPDEENDYFDSLEEVYSKITGGHVNRTKSDTLPASGEVPVKLPAKMKKSASMKSAFAHFEEDKIVEARRPATVRERRAAAEDDDVEVDAKADDFINKFKNQLKLQRLDSIIRYKDMVNRGGGK